MIILCEDLQHYVFVRRLLKKLGFPHNRIDVEMSPGGSAEQYVREQYPVELEAHRSKASHLNIGLVVVVDADTNAVSDRCQELRESARDKGRDARGADERICILIPKRNIETWIHALQGENVNEQKSYPRLKNESDCAQAVDTLADYVKGGSFSNTTSSIRRGRKELQNRLPE